MSYLFFSLQSFAQQQEDAHHIVTGIVTDSLGLGIEGVSVSVLKSNIGTHSDVEGKFRIEFKIKGNYHLKFTHVEYVAVQKRIKINEQSQFISVSLNADIRMLESVNVQSPRENLTISAITIKSATLQNISAPFNDISNVLASLPSVVSNNELSSSYSVRGGNYDENIVRVNGITVYRPFLVRSGQQEGLSFINNDLVESVSFSAGGWDARNGGKMSSLLLADYKQFSGWHGGVKLSLLGASGYVSGNIGDASLLVGVRHKQSKYLLNSLDVTGQYVPKFTDIQNHWKFPVTDKFSIETLFAYAANKYQVTPENGIISFGTFNQELRFEVGFEGQEQMFYNTLQGAVKVNYQLNEKLELHLVTSLLQTYETENGEVEGSYRLCDVDKDLSSSTFNDCIQIRGIGTLYQYARNALDATIADAEFSGSYHVNISNNLDFGLSISNRLINSNLNEYSFTDSIGYTTITRAQKSNNTISANQVGFYGQHAYQGNQFGVTYGVYASQNTLNGKLAIDPRFLFNYSPVGHKNLVLRFGTGLYQQQPFYRELLDVNGQPVNDPATQSALHFVLGSNQQFTWWGRGFNFSTEVYYKALRNLVPYQFENVRVQYYPNHSATGSATGFEVRLSGAFIEGTESWFSFGLLSTKEQIEGIDNALERRPTDQRFKLGVVFEDHIPNDPTLRVNLSLQYGSGLPMGPPGDLTQRTIFTGDAYTRVDMMFSKVFKMNVPHWDNIRVGVGIYNLLGSKNAVNYSWIKDFSGQQFAVPNNLTGRLFNLTLSTDF